MISSDALQTLISNLPQYSNATTRLCDVNWRNGFQIRATYRGSYGICCYVSFDVGSQRDSILRALKAKHGTAKCKKRLTSRYDGLEDLETESDNFISVNEIASEAAKLGYKFTVIYVCESPAYRANFAEAGIPLVPGEMGKEWANNEFISYSCPTGRNL